MKIKTPKQIFDKYYEYYRNMKFNPTIPLESRELIFNVAKTYHDQFELSDEEIEATIIEYYKSDFLKLSEGVIFDMVKGAKVYREQQRREK